MKKIITYICEKCGNMHCTLEIKSDIFPLMCILIENSPVPWKRVKRIKMIKESKNVDNI